MMKAAIFILLTMMTSLSSSCQTVNSSNLINLQILDDSLKFDSKDWKKNIAFTMRNESHRRVLFYGINNSGLGTIPFESSQLCELEHVGLGLGLIIYDDDGAQLFPSITIVDRLGDKPMTKSRLDGTLQAYRDKIASDTTVFKGLDEKTFTKMIDVSRYELKKGNYLLQIVIYCGKKITFSVSEEKIILDSKRLNSVLYQGCFFSNKVKVIVE